MAETPPEAVKYPPGLRARGKKLWRELHSSADFTDCPENTMIAEEACYLADEITTQRKLIRLAGDHTRVIGSQKQPVSMPEIAYLQKNQNSRLSTCLAPGTRICRPLRQRTKSFNMAGWQTW